MTLVLALGGGLGACMRYVVDAWIRQQWRGGFPWATFVINVTGSFVCGLCVAGLPPGAVVDFVGTGVMGGYTTLSAASVEAVTQGSARRGAAYAVVSLVAAVCAAWCGLVVAG
ncbi:fluoride efflux transporter FluC [Corynebacterium kroppenstedtii]|uniref:fluoride efflux transporter FluC n=1 Tax=Corynebacterium sp. PCR 32 TaxID=3351342 RepID=UPI0030A0EE2D